MTRLELVKVKADLERSLEALVLNCSKCGLDIHWVSGRDAGTMGAPGALAARLAGDVSALSSPKKLTRRLGNRSKAGFSGAWGFWRWL